MTTKIAVNNLVKIFGDHPQKALQMLEGGAANETILKKTRHSVGVGGVTFEVEEGELLVVMGLSGSGKSTLIRCLNRLIEPTSGEITIDGIDVTRLDSDELRDFRREKFAMVFQHFALFPHRTVVENTEFGLEIQGIEPEERRAKALESLELVGLKGWEDSYPDQLSGGMQQRVGLARALAVDPEILLMDEAFSALDPLIRREMQDELMELQERVNKTIIFISHDLDEAIKLGDRIILMKDGRIVQQGTPEEVLTNPATRYVEKFVEDVDMTKVLTAESVMKKPWATARMSDGPRTILRKMEGAGLGHIYVIDKEHKLRGVFLADDAYEALQQGVGTMPDIIIRDVEKVSPDTPIQDIFTTSLEQHYPVAVVNDSNKLLGVIDRTSLIAGLANIGD